MGSYVEPVLTKFRQFDLRLYPGSVKATPIVDIAKVTMMPWPLMSAFFSVQGMMMMMMMMMMREPLDLPRTLLLVPTLIRPFDLAPHTLLIYPSHTLLNYPQVLI